MSTCINKNNGNVTKLSEITGLPAAAVAAKIAVWQSNGNEGKIPTHVDLGMPFLPWSKNIDIYKQYNLLNVEGTIKDLTESAAKKWATVNNNSPEYYFEARLNAAGKWVIAIAKRLWDKRNNSQLALFNKTEGDMLPNQTVITILDKLKNRFKVDYQIISPAEAKGLLSNTRDGYNNETGFYFGNKVYIVDNGDGLDLDSAIHEYGHPFMRALNKYNPSLFQNIVADILATNRGKQILQEVIDLKYDKEEQAEEIAVRALTILAKKDYNLKTGSLFEKAVEKLLRFLTTMLKDVFGRKELKLSTLSAETSLQTLSDIFNLKQGVVNLNEIVNIKPGVQELFDSTPELANQVYETLGFDNTVTSKVILQKKFADTYNIIYNNETIGTIDIPSDLEGDTISIGDVNIKQEFRGKGLGVETYKAAMQIADKPLESFMATDEANRVWNSLIKQGLAKKTETGFISINNQITPQQKQQALQLYSQYLDTIFPDSKVKDIVYHGTDKDFDAFIKQFENGIFLTKNKNYAKVYGSNIKQVIINSQNLLNIYNLARTDKRDEDINLFIDFQDFIDENDNRGYSLKQLNDREESLNNKVISLTNRPFLYEFYKEKGYDSLLGSDEYVVFEPEQIHILGSKQDIEGFKEFTRGQKNDKVAFNRKVEPKNQKEIYDKINPVGKISKEGDEYVVLGEKGYKRVTSITQKTFGLGNKDTEMSQFLGNMFHAIAANAVKEAFPDFNKHFKTIELVDAPDNKQFSLSTLPDISRNNILAIIKPVIEAAKKQGSVLSAELMVANTKTKIAGTIDLLEITKDGEIKSLDYKTSMNKGTTKSNYKKLLGNSEQQILYKKILDYDDPNLGREGINIKYQELMKIVSYMKDGIPTFKVLETSPVIYQTSLDKRKNEMLGELFNQIKMLDNKKDKNNIEKINALMDAKLKLMQSIQKGVKDNEMLSVIMEDLIAIEVFMSENKNINNYIEFRKDLSMYENIGSFINITKENTDLIEKIQGRAKRLYQQMYSNIEENFANNAAKDLSFEGSIITSPEDVLAPVKDINAYQANFKGASYISNPIVAYIYKTVSTAIAKARKQSSEMSSKINKAVKNLESYMGMTGEKIYEPLLQYLNGKPTGYLVDKYSSVFYEERKNAKKNGDLNWFKNNTILDTESYNKKKNSYVEFLKNKFNADLLVKIESLKKSKKYKEEIIESEAKKYVTKDHNLALAKWIKDNNNIMLFNIPTDKWIDSKWKEIKEGKYKGTPVEEFYDMYTSTMESIEDFVPFDIRKNYIAEFKRSFIERIITNGIGDMKLGESLVNSISMTSDDSYLEINPFTGKYVRNIPILGKMQIPFKNKKSFIENEKSYDLGKSLTIFFESAMRYHELSLVEHVHETGRDILLNQKEQILTASGEEAKGGFNLSKTAKGLENTINSLDYFIQSTVYGKSTDEGSSFTVEKESFVGRVFDSLGMMGEKSEINISSVKLLNSILRYTGLNNLGYNLYSPITNLLGGKSMQLLMGVGGRWYDVKDYSFASSVVSLGPFSNLTEDARKARLFIDMFQLQSSEYSDKEKEKNSTGFKAFSSIPGPMSGMTSTESHMQNAGLIAMIKSNKHSIKWNDWKVVNDELQYIGENSLDEGVKEAFRQKVLHVNGRALGNMNPDDKIKIKQFFLGRAITQHRGWIPAMLEAHWSSKKYNYVLGEYVEGRFNTLIRFVTINKLNWKNLSNEDKANVKEAIAEISIILLAYGLYAAVAGSDEDKEKRKKLKYLLKVLSRYKSEMMFFTGFGYADMHKILISPAPSISTLERFGRLLGSIKDISVSDEKDLEKIEKKLKKNVGQMIPYWSQGSRFFDDIVKNEINEVK
jgi:hypothetical protein